MVVYQNAGWARRPDACDGAFINGTPLAGIILFRENPLLQCC